MVSLWKSAHHGVCSFGVSLFLRQYHTHPVVTPIRTTSRVVDSAPRVASSQLASFFPGFSPSLSAVVTSFGEEAGHSDMLPATVERSVVYKTMDLYLLHITPALMSGKRPSGDIVPQSVSTSAELHILKSCSSELAPKHDALQAEAPTHPMKQWQPAQLKLI